MILTEDLLVIRDLHTYFYTYEGVVRAIEGINLNIKRKERLALVGETGSGKSVTALSIMRLIQWPPGRIVRGEIILDGEDLLKKSEKEMRSIRGSKMSMIFQEPMTSLNPVLTIEDQIYDVLMAHQGIKKQRNSKKAVDLLRQVSMPDPEAVAKQYPYELSGGMRQRALIAIEVSCLPALLIADEPTSFLDVTVQVQILDLLNRLLQRLGASMLLITHDLGIAAQTCDRIAVMYAGNIVESGDVRSVFKNPRHPYTKGLFGAIPRLIGEKKRLCPIPGTVPNLISPPTGCRFHPRCQHAQQICEKMAPILTEVESGHTVCCFLYSGGEFGEKNER
jgi:oligopeptide/dipeptide ABC transporter ATP-binding protein